MRDRNKALFPGFRCSRSASPRPGTPATFTEARPRPQTAPTPPPPARPARPSRALTLRPLARDEANAHIRRWHRHNAAVKGHKFAIGVQLGRELLGVVVVGRPSARALDNGLTFEVTRLALIPNAPRNAASKLLAAAWRAARAMGVTRLISYTRADERGTCYRAAGWAPAARVRARPWSTASRPAPWLPGLESPATEPVPRTRWQISAPPSRRPRAAPPCQASGA
jgi:hypothetical protein